MYMYVHVTCVYMLSNYIYSDDVTLQSVPHPIRRCGQALDRTGTQEGVKALWNTGVAVNNVCDKSS